MPLKDEISSELMGRVVDNLIRDCVADFSVHKFNILAELMCEGVDFNRCMLSGNSPRWIPNTMVSLSRKARGIIDLERLLNAGMSVNRSMADIVRSSEAHDTLDVLNFWKASSPSILEAEGYLDYQDALLSRGADPFACLESGKTGLVHSMIIWSTEKHHHGDWKIARLLESPYLSDEDRHLLLNQKDRAGRRPVDLAIQNTMANTDGNRESVNILLLLFEHGVDVIGALDAAMTPMDPEPKRLFDLLYPEAVARKAASLMKADGEHQRPRL